MSKARNGKFCLKLQISLMLQWRNWYVSTLGWRWTESITAISCCLMQQMLQAIKHVTGNTFVFHKTALWHIAPETPFSWCSRRYPTSLVLTSLRGRQTVQIWTPVDIWGVVQHWVCR